jgi:hypothetical protein
MPAGWVPLVHPDFGHPRYRPDNVEREWSAGQPQPAEAERPRKTPLWHRYGLEELRDRRIKRRQRRSNDRLFPNVKGTDLGSWLDNLLPQAQMEVEEERRNPDLRKKREKDAKRAGKAVAAGRSTRSGRKKKRTGPRWIDSDGGYSPVTSSLTTEDSNAEISTPQESTTTSEDSGGEENSGPPAEYIKQRVRNISVSSWDDLESLF